jgi:two-component system phosphate regulon sensor histidine kinase PhoR
MINKLRISLKNKILLNVAMIILVFVGLLIVALNMLAIRAFTANEKEEVSAIVEGQASKVEFALTRPLEHVKTISKNEVLVKYLEQQNITSTKQGASQLLEHMMIGTGYANVYVMDMSGEVILSADTSFLKNNFAFRDYFQKAKEGEPHVQIAFGVLTQKPGYYFSAPIFVEGEVGGVVVIKVEVAYVDDLFDESLIKTIGHYFLTDENGVVVSTDKDIEPYQSMGKISESKINSMIHERRYDGFGVKPLQYQVVQDVIENYSQSVSIDFQDFDEGEGDEFERELLKVERVGELPFYLITESNLESIFGRINDILWPISVLLIAAFVMGMGILSVVFKHNFRPLSKLEEYTKDVAKGQYSQLVKLHTNDEIQSLSESLSTMVATLQDAKLQLEQKVDVKTSELNTNLAALETKNLQMRKNEVAMLNILEDSKELEKQLAEEKASVEQKVVERTRELSNEQSRLMASISALPRAFIILDKDNNILIHNKKLDDIYGKQEAEWSVDLIDKLLGSKIDLQALLKKLHKDGENIDISDILYKAKYLRVFAARVVNNNGELLGAVMTIKDESEAKALARSRDEFFSIASHELRTPLTAIRGNTSMIMDYYKEVLKDKQLKEMIVDTHTASVRLIGIVNDFLDMSRLEQGRMEYKLENVNLTGIIDKVVKDLQETASEKGMEIKIESDAEINALVDPGKFEQIMFNLIGNSLKFTDKGSIKITLRKVGSQAKIEVQDTGVGIAIENQSLLFHKFQQAGVSTITRDGSKGTGLGLYISRLMTEGMGGKLELLSSEIGKGSIFSISLPIKNEA